jgi:AmmeMemoRadiSam system protein B
MFKINLALYVIYFLKIIKHSLVILVLAIFLTICNGNAHGDTGINNETFLKSPFDEMIQAALNNRKSVTGAPFGEPSRSCGVSTPWEMTDGPGTEKKAPGLVVGGIAPHHDLAIEMIIDFYSTIAKSRSNIAKNQPGTDRWDQNVTRVFLFSPDHFKKARNFAAACPSAWKLASGVLRADGEALKELADGDLTELRSDLFATEHGISIHIPLIARFFPEAKVVPMVLRSDTPDIALLSIRHKLSKMLQPGDLVILSMDLSHYKTPEAMAMEDEKTLEVLTHLRSFQTRAIDVDARRAAALVLLLFNDLNARNSIVLDHKDSSDLLNKTIISGTSYATIIYSSEE